MSQVNHPGYPNGEEEVEGVLAALEAEHEMLTARGDHRAEQVAEQIKLHEQLLDAAALKKPRARRPVDAAEKR